MVVIDGVEMVDIREAARLVRRSPETVRRWVWSGQVRSVKNGNKLFLARADVEHRLGGAGAATTTGPQQRSLRDWAASPESVVAGRPGVSASDLVLEDRAGR